MKLELKFFFALTQLGNKILDDYMKRFGNFLVFRGVIFRMRVLYMVIGLDVNDIVEYGA